MRYFKIYLLVFGLLLSAKIFSQVNPLLDYYPLHVGDVWRYKVTYDDASRNQKISYLFKRVISDTILENGKRYFLIEQPPFTYNEIDNLERVLIRIDSTDGIVYKYISDNQPEEKVDSLFAGAGIFFRYYTSNTTSEYVFSETRSVRIISGPISSDYFLLWKEAENIGIYHQQNYIAIVTAEGNQYDLVYAKINGVEYGQLVDIREEKNFLPQEFSLSQNYPNPFNPSTTIRFSVPAVRTQHAVFLQLKVFDLLGREIATLVDEEKYPGNYEVKFDGTSLTSGVYFYRLFAGNYVATKKMILIR